MREDQALIADSRLLRHTEPMAVPALVQPVDRPT